MEKASRNTAKVIFKELEIAKYRLTFCRFPLCFISINVFYALIFWGNFK